jgi:predicted aspartyl protease
MKLPTVLPTDRCCRQNRCRLLARFSLSARYRLALRCRFLILGLAFAGAHAAQAQQTKETVKFQLRSGYLMVVQARVNGAGPFSFLVDTGTTRTVIDPELASQLQLPAVGEVNVTTVLHYRQDKLVRLQDIRLGQASVSGLGAIVDKLTRQKMLAPGIRGVLGEDFLSRFDLLIDYKERVIRFGEPPPAGERCRFEATGQYQGAPTTNRLLIDVEFMQVSGNKVQLQLDTGARTPELFPVSHDSHPSQPWGSSMATSNGANGVIVHSNVTLKIGATMIPGQDVVQSRRAVAFDAAGLLPAAIFHRIYICHSGGYVVLNPVK